MLDCLGEKQVIQLEKQWLQCLTKNSVPETQIIQLAGDKNLQSK